MVRILVSITGFTALAVLSPSFAQDAQPPAVINVVKTDRIISTDSARSGRWAALGPNGQIYIDWDMVERLANSQISPADSEAAQLLLAVRDGRWRNMAR